MSIKKYLSIALIFIFMPLVIFEFLNYLTFHIEYRSMTLHAEVEILGSIIAILTAILLSVKSELLQEKEYVFVSLAFMSMGILDGIHAFLIPGDAFVFSHTVASLYGAIFASMVWFEKIHSFVYNHKKSIIVATVILSIATGLISFIEPWPQYLSMLNHNELQLEFSSFAIYLNTFAGVLFIFAALYFYLEYTKNKNKEHLLFFIFLFLFAISELIFKDSHLWHSEWWLWHVLRMISYIVVFIYLIYVIKKIIDVLRDTISQNQIIQLELQEREKKFKNIFDNSSDGIIIHDLQGTILEVNSVKSIRLGYSVEELRYKHISFLDTPTFREKIPQKIKEILQNKHATFESEHISKDGRIIPVEINAKLIEYNNETAILSVIRDITERKKAEAEIIMAKEEAEAANEAKSMFLSNMSHEIRTPLNGIIGLTQLTLDTELTSQQKYYLNKVQISSHSLLHIINDILDYSKIQAGKLVLVNEPFALEQILENLSGLFGFAAEKKGIELFFKIDKNIPQSLIGDQLRLTQILINLIGNAIKFTDRGEIILTINSLSMDENGCELEVMVQDTGIGIEFEKQKELFQNFSQVDNSYKRKYEGTGLGLAISKELVELMQGKISMHSVFGEGSTLCFNAKFEIDNATKSQVQNIKRGDSVLVVDDSKTSRIILSDILKSIGMVVDLCEDGPTALEKIEQLLNENKLYDFILLDWKMPKLSGAQTAKKIDELYKRFEIKHKPIVVMVTSYSKDELLDELNQYDIKPANVLIKPITSSILYNALIMNKQKRHANHKEIYKYDERLKPIEGADVLLVEDNEINQDVAKAYLVKMKVNVIVANNGKEALDLVQENFYDMILMDLQMPVMDGIEATKEIKKIDKKKEIPIIAMTAAAMEKDRGNSKKAGMQAHITKPIEFEELKEILIKFIKPNLENRNFLVKAKQVSSTPSEFPKIIEGINTTKLMLNLDQDTSLASKLLLDFAKEYENLDKELEENAIGTQEFNSLIHTLKGVSGNLLISDVYEYAKTIDESDDLSVKQALLEPLKNELTKVVQNIKLSIQTPMMNIPESQCSTDEIVLLLDSIIEKINLNFMISFEDIQTLLEQLMCIIDEAKIKELEENFDQLDYENVKKSLKSIKENLDEGASNE